MSQGNKHNPQSFEAVPIRAWWFALWLTCFAGLLMAMFITVALQADPGQIEGPLFRGYRQAPEAYRAAVKSVLPCVVTIETFGGLAAPPKGDGQARRAISINKPGQGYATGLVISSDGYIITSTYNFILKPRTIIVTLADGSRHVAKLLGRDETRKVCVLKIELEASSADAKALQVPEFIDSRHLHVGQWAISVGSGYNGKQPALSVGIISALNRVFGKAVQADANISPVNYGGPLIDIQGRVIGICTPLSPASNQAMAGVEWYDSGIGFAIPLHGSPPWLEELKRGRDIYPADLGIEVSPVKPQVKLAGILIRQVHKQSPAELAGLSTGDTITAADGRQIRDPMAWRSFVGRCSPGQEITLAVQRGGKTFDVSATLVAAESGREKKQAPVADLPENEKEDAPDRDEDRD